MLDLQKAIIKYSNLDIVPENSIVGDSAGNEAMEAGIKTAEGMIRTIKAGLEHNYKIKILKDHPIMSWVIEHSVFLVTYFGLGRNGKTPYQLLKGKLMHRTLVEIGEKV